MGCDHFDPVALGQIAVQSVTVIGLVADQSRREGVEEAVPEDPFDQLAFVRRGAFDTNGERKTVIIRESDDFRPLAAFGGPDCEAPFFAPVKEASMKASSKSSFPRAVTPRPVRARCAPVCLPARTAGNGDGRSGTAGTCWAVRAPALRGAQHPQNSVEDRSRVLPRPTTTVGTPLRS
jgi:hypothetical protein